MNLKDCRPTLRRTWIYSVGIVAWPCVKPCIGFGFFGLCRNMNSEPWLTWSVHNSSERGRSHCVVAPAGLFLCGVVGFTLSLEDTSPGVVFGFGECNYAFLQTQYKCSYGGCHEAKTVVSFGILFHFCYDISIRNFFQSNIFVIGLGGLQEKAWFT